jgi:sec-independent protein translocase protein TatB
MFDITSSKLLILGIVALLVIGPKDLPALLRTIGKYVGIIKRHAADFRAQFDEAIRESELDQLKKDVEKLGAEAETTMHEAEHSVGKELADARQDMDAALAADPMAHDANGLPMTATADAAPETTPALNGASHSHEAATPAPAQAETAAGEPGGAGVKSGA